MLEFLGGSSLENATSVYITGEDSSPDVWFTPRPLGDLWRCLDEGFDVGRSLWDRRSLVAHLDIEYVNFDFPAAPYIDPVRAFDLQRPVVDAVQEVLLAYGIAPLHVLTGRGHHFVWRIDRHSIAFESLAKFGRLPASLRARNAQPQPPNGETVEPKLGAAFAGLGQVLEYVAHRVLQRSATECEIPVMFTAVEAGGNGRGREVISIDLSEYGDPLHTRGMRIPFSAYLKPQQQRWKLGDVVDQIPPLFLIPLHEMDERQGLLAMRDIGQVVEIAQQASVQIPDQSAGSESLVSAYTASRLADWHEFFYSQEHDPCERWAATYDCTPLESLPVCARVILEQPNELLLKPAAIQHIVRILLAVGWHPRHIAGLIRSKYERDYGWGDKWFLYDASARADFYTRLFAGLIATGLDDLVDLNCRSCQEKRYCPAHQCDNNLSGFKSLLLARRTATSRFGPLHSESAV